MNHKLKALGTALIAVFAMSAAFASMASADELTSEISPVTITGLGGLGAEINKLSFPEVGNTECTSSSYQVTTTIPTTSVSATPTYAGCTSLGFPASIHMNGCSYTLTIEPGSGGTYLIGSVVCPAGQEITVTANPPTPTVGPTRKCVIHIPAQSNREKIDVTNVGSLTTRELLFHLEMSNITATSTTGSTLGPDGHPLGTGLGSCPGKSTSKATLTGTVKVTGEEDKPSGANHKGIFVS
jgi:hypothetical protein